MLTCWFLKLQSVFFFLWDASPSMMVFRKNSIGVKNFSQEGLAFMWSFTPVRGMLGSPWPCGSTIVGASQFLGSCFFSTFSQWHTVNCLHPLPMHRMQGNCGKISLMQSRHWDAVRRGRLLMQLRSNVNCTELLQLLLLLLQLRFTTIVSNCAISAY